MLAFAISLPLLALWLLADAARADDALPPPPAGDFSCQPFNSYDCTPERLAELDAYAARVKAAPLPEGGIGLLDLGPTTFTLWYGEDQTFGQVGDPQLWINFLGNVSDPDGVSKLEYALNGGAVLTATVGPDDRRLNAAGDFNIEIAITDTALINGANQLVLTATDSLDNAVARTVNFTYSAGNTWPANYSVDWGGAGGLQDKVQIMDGRWSQSAAGLRLLAPNYMGYDRAIAIGDMGWEQYEITLPITVHAVDPDAYNPAIYPYSGSPGMGIVLRWRGHTNAPVVCPQPHCGWLPWGGSAWYDWGFNGGGFKLNGDTAVLAADPAGRKLETGVPYYWKARVEEAPGGRSLYRMKVWKVGQPEPQHWDLSALGDAVELASGSLVLVAHHVDATFGDLTITPGPFTDSLAPLIRDIRVARRDTSATVVWSTNEPATGQVDYGLTAGYGSTATASARQLRQAVTLSGLTPNMEYHYRVTAYDVFGNAAQSVDLTFTTVGGTSGFGASDVISDDFNRCALGSSLWTLTDQYQDATLGVAGGYTSNARLSLGVPDGVVHPIGYGAVLVPRVWQPIADTDLEVVARFDSPLTLQGQSQGLLFERDDAGLLRVEFNANGGFTRVYAAAYSGGSASTRVNTNIGTLNFSPMYLRVRRQANQWAVAYSFDGSAWTTAGSTFTQTLAVTRLGIFAANASPNPDGSDAPAHTLLADYVFNGVSPVVPEDGALNTLTVTTTGQGAVLVNPSSSNYACGQVVTLTADPPDGWGFAGWSGALGGSANPAQVTMTAPQTVQATFVALDGGQVFLPLIVRGDH